MRIFPASKNENNFPHRGGEATTDNVNGVIVANDSGAESSSKKYGHKPYATMGTDKKRV